MQAENIARVFLNPNKRLIDEVVGWLCGNDHHVGRVRLEEGAHSLAHILLVMPTAQSARALRLALAQEAASRHWGGLIPPGTALPMTLIKTTDKSVRTANTIELQAAFLKFMDETSRTNNLRTYPHLFQPTLAGNFRTQLAFFDQLMDVWRILARGGLIMADVPNHPRAAKKLTEVLGDEKVRWQELAAFETHFCTFLHTLGLRHQAEEIHLAKTQAESIAPSIEEVVLPVLADPVAVLYDILQQQRNELTITVLLHASKNENDKFDTWGRPKTDCWTGNNHPILETLRDCDIIRSASDHELAQCVVKDFPAADTNYKRPTLGLCDNALYPELAGAFLNAGYVLHNPERHHLSRASLGQIVTHLLDLYAIRNDCLPWDAFTALMRTDDILSALTASETQMTRVSLLTGLDICQNTFFPAVLPPNLDWNTSSLRISDREYVNHFITAARTLLNLLSNAWQDNATPAAFLRNSLQMLFKDRTLSGVETEKEFRAAIDSLCDILNTFDGETISALHLTEGAQIGLLRKALAEASYSLEPTDPNAIRTEGWLELIWSAADKITLVGFTEGAVPDSVVGHLFLPDELRIALGLTSNAERLARDTMFLYDIVRARTLTPGSVRAYISQTNAAGDQRRPSRLLFLVKPTTLASRVQTLFSDLPSPKIRKARQIEEQWHLRLPTENIPLPHAKNGVESLSASAIDQWLRCPFTYLLSIGLGMKHVEEKEELDDNDFGTLVHATLEDYANEQLLRTQQGLTQLCDVRDISAALSRLLTARHDKIGKYLTLKVRLQFDAALGRLLAFAPLQARWATEGWQIAERPEYKFSVRPFAGEGIYDLPFNGSIDRIDFHPQHGYRLIDYKTWDLCKNVKNHILTSNVKQIAFAQRLKLPQILETKTSTKKDEPPKKEKSLRLLSIQLLLYTQCLMCDNEKFKGHIADCCYAILGCDAKNTVIFGSAFDQGPFETNKQSWTKVNLISYLDFALETTKTAIKHIKNNIFWPPGPTEEWKYNFKELFTFSPEKDLSIGTKWRDEQEAKLNALEVKP